MPNVYQKNAVEVRVSLNAHSCHECGVIYGLDSDFEERRRKDGKTFWCPNGHGAVFADTLKDKLAAETERARRLQQQLTASYAAQDQIDAENQRLTKEARRIERRIHAGVCPHCNRTFVNLQRHMHSKHEGKEAALAETARSKKS